MRGEIERLEKTVHTLGRLPWLVRREYWVSQIEVLMQAPAISADDRRRLGRLLDALSAMSTNLPLPA